ncbi:class I SAM-dependent methyltransferase [Scytonema sp. PRP1]|uniref:class I SAM-dependent methyltransferase n=1 Tax=Scytonema sp. PRP1 TaxID=3120513 RepID=UPI002FD17F31
MADLEETPPYTWNPLSRFCDFASDYAKYRPSYPAAAIDFILEGIDTQLPIVVADVGAGTGISSRLLAERGVRVLAIEPNADMRQAAAPHPRVEFREATAEATGLSDASVDLITCFQSFHWFNPEPTLLEFHRILKPSGRLAAVWNEWDKNDEFTANYIDLVLEAANLPSNEKYRTTVEYLASYHLVDIKHYVFPYKQDVDLTGLIGLTQSHSIVPRSGSVLQQLISDLQQLHVQFCDQGGMVSLLYSTDVFLAKPKP